MRESVIRNLTDLLILKELGKETNLSGGDFLSLFHDKYSVSVNSGSIFSMLYALEHKGLVESSMRSGKKTYKLTRKGKKKIKYVLSNLDSIFSFVRSVLDENSLSKLL